MPARILIVDDHELSRAGIKTILSRAPGLEVCGEAADGNDAVEKFRDLRPDLVIMDALMPRANGIDAARKIRKLSPSAKILVVSMHDSASLVQLATVVGADAFLTKAQCGHYLNETVKFLLRSPATGTAAPAPPATSASPAA